MIGSLRGRIAAKTPPQLTVEVGGLGYELEAPMSTFFHLPAIGAEVHLLTHLVVREDAHVLYGFATEEERRLFRSLIKVSGVGPKIALALLSGISVSGFHAVRAERGHHRPDARAGHRAQDRRAADHRDARPAGRARSPVAAHAPSRGHESRRARPMTHWWRSAIARPRPTRLLKAVGPGTQSTEELIRRALQGAVRE